MKALNEKRKEIKNQCLAPYEDFEKKLKEIIEIVNEPITLIDSQVKEFEEKQRADKLEKINMIIDGVKEELPEGIIIPIDSKWLNVSVSIKSIKEAVNEKVEKVKNDLTTLSNLPEFGFEATEVYKSTLDLNETINEAKRMSDMAKARVEHEAAMKAKAEEYERLAKEKEEAVEEAADIEELPVEESVSVENFIPSFDEIEKASWVELKMLMTKSQLEELKQYLNERKIKFVW